VTAVAEVVDRRVLIRELRTAERRLHMLAGELDRLRAEVDQRVGWLAGELAARRAEVADLRKCCYPPRRGTGRRAGQWSPTQEQMVARLLAETTLPVAEIAARAGVSASRTYERARRVPRPAPAQRTRRVSHGT